MKLLYALPLVPVVIVSIAIYRFWAWIRYLGYQKELIRRAPQMMPLDGVTIYIGTMVFYYAAMGLWGFTLPFLDDEALPASQNIIMSVISVLIFAGLISTNVIRRFKRPSWDGMREGAVRTLAAFHIIDEDELTRALNVLQQLEAGQASTPVKDAAETRKEKR